jgi:RNA polymerase sigma-70 factor (ECF subfamily)
MTEDDIIKLIRSGGKATDEGVKALYQSTAQPMLRFFVYRGVSADEAKDVLQDTFVKIVRSASSFVGDGTAKAWIWQIARNCLIDNQRKQPHQQPSPNEKRVSENIEHSVTEIRKNAESSTLAGLPVTTYQYAGNADRFHGPSLVMPVGDEEWERIEQNTAAPSLESFVDERSAEECVSMGLEEFSEKEPERAHVLLLQMDGSSIEEIGRQIGRTVAATKEYLSQCKKKIQPYIAHCTELLTA